MCLSIYVSCYVCLFAAFMFFQKYLSKCPFSRWKNKKEVESIHQTVICVAQMMRYPVYPKDPEVPCKRMSFRGTITETKRKVCRFHETILSFGEPGSLGIGIQELFWQWKYCMYSCELSRMWPPRNR